MTFPRARDLTEARRKVRETSTKMLTVVESKTMTPAQQTRALAPLEPELAHWVKEVDDREHINAQLTKHFGSVGAGLAAGGSGPYQQHASPLGAAPALMPNEEQMRALHDATLSHKSLRIDVGAKTVGDDLPSGLLPGVVPFPHEPTRLLDLLQKVATSMPVVEYIRHASTTGSAGVTAAGATKPAVTLVTDKVEARARKIAVTTSVNDEDLADFTAFAGYISAELQRLVVDAENAELLSGDGTGEHLLGLLAQTGILTRVQAASPATALDTLAQAFTDLRVGAAFATASLLVLHPTTWSVIQRAKNTLGNYILGDPSSGEPANVWNTPVLQTSTIPVGTGLALDVTQAATAHIRSGISIQTDYGQTGFEKNQTVFRCEERLALAVPRPSAIIKITALA